MNVRFVDFRASGKPLLITHGILKDAEGIEVGTRELIYFADLETGICEAHQSAVSNHRVKLQYKAPLTFHAHKD